MTALETHVADFCPRCTGKRDLRIDYRTRRYKIDLPKACADKIICESELRQAAGFEPGRAA